MVATKIIRYVKYICDPRNITIEVEFPVNSRHFVIKLNVDAKTAKRAVYNVSFFPTQREEIDKIIEKFCDNFLNFKETDLYRIADEYMPALYVHRKLQKVLSKPGNLVWARS
jgi:hypothetical protein